MPESIHIIEGESVEVPVNIDGDINRNNVSLKMSRDNMLLSNMF